MTHILNRLQAWYLKQCNGSWEHEKGIRIDTIDNPGWSLTVDLGGTAAAGEPFVPVQHQRSETDWISCRIQSERFEAFGGPSNLEELLSIFLSWVEGAEAKPAS